jgi:multiple sugar transport system permease protein
MNRLARITDTLRPRSTEFALPASLGRTLLSMLLYLLLLLIVALIAGPFLWMISNAFKDQTTIYSNPPTWIPSPAIFDNFVTAWTQVPFGMFFLNSIKVASLITMGQLVTCSMAAYAFARLRFPGREVVFGLYLSSLMVPGQVIVIPLYILMRNLGLVDTHAALILPALASAFGTFLLRQFFLTIPRELEEAAIIDGAGMMRVLLTIILPLSRPALAALAIFTFTYFWNDFFNPLIFLDSPQNLTLPVGLALLQGQYSGTSPAVMLAGVCMAIVPVFIVFLIGQRHIVEGITLTGLKG